MDHVTRTQTRERVLYRTGAHWIIAVNAFLMAGIGVPLIIIGIPTYINKADFAECCLGSGLILTGFALISWIRAGITYCTTELTLTNQRIIAKTGLVNRHSLEIPLSTVTYIRVTQDSRFAKLLHYGRFEVFLNTFWNIAKPIKFQERVRHQIVKLWPDTEVIPEENEAEVTLYFRWRRQG